MALHSFSCPHEAAKICTPNYYPHTSNFIRKIVEKCKKTETIRYIHYNSKIRYIQIVPNHGAIGWVCFGQFETLGSTNACVVQMLHAVQACREIHGFSVLELLHQKYGLQKLHNLLQNLFSCPRLDAPLTGTRLLYAHLQFRPKKCQKPVKFKKSVKYPL